MTLKDNVQVNILVLLPFFKTVCSSCYTFLRKKKKTTKNYFGSGHEKKKFVFSKSTSFYDTEQT